MLTDVHLELEHNRLRPVYKVSTDKRRLPTKPGLFSDMGMVSGDDNLAQAVVVRLLTPTGELAALGHPDYGSRVESLIGAKNTENTRNLLRLYILESLAREPRISETQLVSVEQHEVYRNAVIILLRVVPSDSTEAVTIGPFTLELES